MSNTPFLALIVKVISNKIKDDLYWIDKYLILHYLIVNAFL